MTLNYFRRKMTFAVLWSKGCGSAKRREAGFARWVSNVSTQPSPTGGGFSVSPIPAHGMPIPARWTAFCAFFEGGRHSGERRKRAYRLLKEWWSREVAKGGSDAHARPGRSNRLRIHHTWSVGLTGFQRGRHRGLYWKAGERGILRFWYRFQAETKSPNKTRREREEEEGSGGCLNTQ
jgi:hypothetical protein